MTGPERVQGPAAATPAATSGRRPAGVALTVVSVLIGVMLLVLALPGAGGLSGWPGVAQAVSLRPLLLLGSLGVAALSVLLPLARRRSRGSARPSRTMLWLCLAGLLGATGQGVMLAHRGWGGAPLPAPDARGEDVLVVLTANTFDADRPEGIAELVLDVRADVTVLPETSEQTAAAAARLLAEHGFAVEVTARQHGRSGVTSTALLTRPELGDYAIREVGTGIHASYLAVSDGSGPPVAAAHPFPPLGPRSLTEWRQDTSWVADLCERTPGVVLAGDLNATLDHPALRGLRRCADAAERLDAAARGTWPASWPAWLGAPIDHVLFDQETWRAVGIEIPPPVDGADHRAVAVALQRR